MYKVTIPEEAQPALGFRVYLEKNRGTKEPMVFILCPNGTYKSIGYELDEKFSLADLRIDMERVSELDEDASDSTFYKSIKFGEIDDITTLRMVLDGFAPNNGSIGYRKALYDKVFSIYLDWELERYYTREQNNMTSKETGP